jgi:hypothetical protein
MKPAIAFWMASIVASVAAKPVSVSRIAGDYRVTIIVSESTPRTHLIDSVQHGKEHFVLPASLFDDLRNDRIGPEYKASEFTIEHKKSTIYINVKVGPEDAADDDTWILSPPLKDASRLTRNSRKTGFAQTRAAIHLTRP